MAAAPRSFAAAAASGSAAPAAQNGLGASSSGASSAMSRDHQRIIALNAATIGSLVRVQTTEGPIYQGTVRAASFQDGPGIALSNAHRVNGGLTDEKQALEGDAIPDLLLRKDHVAQIYVVVKNAAASTPASAPAAAGAAAAVPTAAAAPAAAKGGDKWGKGPVDKAARAGDKDKAASAASSSVDLLTDGAISAAHAPAVHALQRWDEPDDKSLTASTELDRDSMGSWSATEMIRAHEKQLKQKGKQSTYRDTLYTTAIDVSAPDYQRRLREADVAAREIESQGSREDTKLENSAESEEAQFSQVLADKAGPKKDESTRKNQTAEFKKFSENLKIGSKPAASPPTTQKAASPSAVSSVPGAPAPAFAAAATGTGTGTGSGSGPSPAATAAAAAAAAAGSPSPAVSDSKAHKGLNPDAKEFVPGSYHPPAAAVPVPALAQHPAALPYATPQISHHHPHPSAHPHPHTHGHAHTHVPQLPYVSHPPAQHLPQPHMVHSHMPPTAAPTLFPQAYPPQVYIYPPQPYPYQQPAYMLPAAYQRGPGPQ